MCQPQGYEDTARPGYICKLKKAIYGLKQSSRTRFSKLSSHLQELGFEASKADTSLFILHRGSLVMYVLVYVDDLIITSSSSSATDVFLQQLNNAFAIKDLGSLHYFLGIEVIPSPGVSSSRKRSIFMKFFRKTICIIASWFSLQWFPLRSFPRQLEVRCHLHMLQNTRAQLVCCVIVLSHGWTFPLQLTRFVSTCRLQLMFIGSP